MVSLFTTSNLEFVRRALGVLESDIAKARAMATKRAFKWAQGQAAREFAKELKVPYRVTKVRVKGKPRPASGSGEIWFGLNDVSAKWLTGSEASAGFTKAKLKLHRFKRVGKKRLPIVKIKKPIEMEGLDYIEGDLSERVLERLAHEFFSALDKLGNRTAGTSRSITGL